MNNLQKKTYEALKRVQEFGDRYTNYFPINTMSSDLFAMVKGILANLDQYIVTEHSGTGTIKKGVLSKANLRKAVISDLEDINRIAKAISYEIVGFDENFRLPRKYTAEAVINLAKAFALDAESVKTQFLRYEMPADFIDQLNKNVDALANATNNKNQAVSDRAVIKAAIDGNLSEGVIIIRKLDAIIRTRFKVDKTFLMGWAAASRIERVKHTSKKTKKDSAPSV